MNHVRGESMRGVRLLIFTMVLAGAVGVRADEPPRRTTRVPRSSERVVRTSEPRATSPNLKPAVPPPVTKPALAQPALLEPRVVLEGLGRGIVACFQIESAAAASWQLTVRELAGPVVSVLEGSGTPPTRIPWDGRLLDGGLAWSAMTYTFELVCADTAGVENRLAGANFVLPAYSREEPAGLSFLLPGRQLAPGRHGDPVDAAIAGLQRTAELLNYDGGLAVVRVEVLARERTTAFALGETVRVALESLLDPPDRPVEVYAGAAAAAPPEGTVLITTVPLPTP
jgi:hypothetical protein